MKTAMSTMEKEIENRVSTAHTAVKDASNGKNLDNLSAFYKYIADKKANAN